MAVKKAVKKSIKKAVVRAKKKTKPSVVEVIVDAIKAKKGDYIVSLDLRKIKNRVCDYFIICQGNSGTQVNAIADSVEEFMNKKLKTKPYHTEGYQNSEWILLDYITTVVHIFQPDLRNFYRLESLWADAEVTKHN